MGTNCPHPSGGDGKMSNQFWYYNGSSYTNITAGTNAIFSNNNDIVYIGSSDPFNLINFTLSVPASASISPQFSFWDGSAYQLVTVTDLTMGLTQSGTITYSNNIFTNWSQNTVNGVTAYYFQIIRTNAATITAPTETNIYVTNNVETVYPALELITHAYYTSGIVSRANQVVQGYQINDGLWLLNELLDFQQVKTDLIPYWQYNQDLILVPNQETYFIPNCVAIESLTFNYADVRYPSSGLSRRVYFGSARAENVITLPFTYNANREKGGMQLNFYPLPASNYPVKFTGKFALTDVSLTTDMLSVYDSSYIAYLRYGLTQKICEYFGVPMPIRAQMTLDEMRRNLMYVSPPDLINISNSIMQGNRGNVINWGQVQIGNGFTVASGR